MISLFLLSCDTSAWSKMENKLLIILLVEKLFSDSLFPPTPFE